MSQQATTTRTMRVTVQLDGDAKQQVLELAVPADLAETARRAMMLRISAEMDWISGYPGDDDPVENLLQLDASRIERRNRMGLDD